MPPVRFVFGDPLEYPFCATAPRSGRAVRSFQSSLDRKGERISKTFQLKIEKICIRNLNTYVLQH